MTLFSAPSDADYRQVSTVPYGKTTVLPAPFSFELETADFV